ncbi:MAG: alanyl-tRNA editing protein [Candidatus Micrarchaeaceae archaeon]
METEKIYLNDAYVKEFDAKVREINGNTIVLDRTAFYPTGGGQPYDTGAIMRGNSIFKVIETKKDGETVLHILERPFDGAVGEAVHGVIDWERRYMHMRLHTAIHVIDAVMEKRKSGAITGGQIYDDRARVDFDMPEMDREKANAVLEEAQKVIDEGKKVYPKLLSKEDAIGVENLSRTEPGRKLMESLKEVRVIVIEGFDMQMDGGTHVSNTKEIGRLELAKYENKGSHNKRIEIKLGEATYKQAAPQG